jgi:hypothetical protein
LIFRIFFLDLLAVRFCRPAAAATEDVSRHHPASKDIDGLILNTGYIDCINRRDSIDYRRLNGAATSSHMAYVDGNYKVNKDLDLRVYQPEVPDLYQQNTLALLHTVKVGEGTLTSDLRSFLSDEDGSAKAGKVDNRNLSALFGYRFGGLYARQWRRSDVLCVRHRVNGPERADHELGLSQCQGAKLAGDVRL